MELEQIKDLVEQARAKLTEYNALANQLAAAGVTIEVDTNYTPHGVVGIGRVDAREIHASFSIEL